MNKIGLIPITIFVLTSLGVSSQASASLILKTYDSDTPTPEIIGGYQMFDFDLIGGSVPTDSVTAPLAGTLVTGSLKFYDRYNNLELMGHSTANTEGWWVNGEVGSDEIGGDNDYDIYTTSLHLIKITLPEDTLAFSFSVGANMGAGAWLTAEELNGPGIPDREYFDLSPIHTPGFGIYADKSDSCSYVKSVTIDPHLIWGFGNFSISRGDCSTQVPEPSVIALFGMGLLGLGFARRRAHN